MVIIELEVDCDLVAAVVGRSSVPEKAVICLGKQRPFVGYAPAHIGPNSYPIGFVRETGEALNTQRQVSRGIALIKTAGAIFTMIFRFLECRGIGIDRSKRFLVPEEILQLQRKVVNAVAVQMKNERCGIIDLDSEREVVTSNSNLFAGRPVLLEPPFKQRFFKNTTSPPVTNRFGPSGV